VEILLTVRWDALTNLPSDVARAAQPYSNIPRLEAQEHDVDKAILKALSLLFVKHRVQHQWGISLLHRRQDTTPDTIMAHDKLFANSHEVD